MSCCSRSVNAVLEMMNEHISLLIESRPYRAGAIMEEVQAVVRKLQEEMNNDEVPDLRQEDGKSSAHRPGRGTGMQS